MSIENPVNVESKPSAEKWEPHKLAEVLYDPDIFLRYLKKSFPDLLNFSFAPKEDWQKAFQEFLLVNGYISQEDIDDGEVGLDIRSENKLVEDHDNPYDSIFTETINLSVDREYTKFGNRGEAENVEPGAGNRLKSFTFMIYLTRMGDERPHEIEIAVQTEVDN